MRSTSLIDGFPQRVPMLSENALRSVVVRRAIHDHLLDALKIEKVSLPRSVVNLLYSGGDLLSGAREFGNSMELGHQVRALYPSLDLLGGATDNFILPRSRLRLTCWPMTPEYVNYLILVAPEEVVERARLSASIYDLLGEETRARGTGEESSGNQMLYSYEILAQGSEFWVEFSLDAHTPDVTVSALCTAIGSWDMWFGGQGRQGRGRMFFTPHFDSDLTPYKDHVLAHEEAMREGLISGDLGTGKILCSE